MRVKLFRRPSASMIVAIVALVVAASGTAVAASTLFKGDNLIKKRSLSGNRLKNHTITGTQVNLRKLGKVPSAKNADSASHANTANRATLANNATNAGNANAANTANTATNATNATNASNVAGLTRFRTVIQPAGTSFANAATVTLGTSGPLSLVGKCFSAAGNTTGAFFLRTTSPGQYSSYSSTTGSPLVVGTDVDVANNDASSAAGTPDFEDPYDGTFGGITNDGAFYITGLASVATNLNAAGGCTFAGYTMAS